MMKKILPTLILLFCSAFVFAVTVTIGNSGNNYIPANVTITVGDTVRFQISNSHNAVEVSQATYNANGNTPLPGGFTRPYGASILTGLTAGLHYYVCTPHASMGMKGIITVLPAAAPVVIPNVWINEIHYDNNGTDTLEGFEIAGPAGTNLACYRVFLYTGGGVYYTDTLAGFIPSQACGFGAVWFPLGTNGFQNGPNDGIVLEYAPTATQCGVNNADTILRFLSYQGTVTATSGRARFVPSVNIGVAETSTTPVGNSLQLTGPGTSYSQFTWTSAVPNTYNLPNNNQLFCGVAPSVQFSVTSSSVTENVGTFNVAVTIQNANATATLVDVNVLAGATATSTIDYNYSPVTITFPAGSSATQNIAVTIINDALAEAVESFTFQLANPTNNATINGTGQHTVTINDNDTLQVSISTTGLSQFENIGVVNIPVLLNRTSPNPTSVTLRLVAGGTATQGVDFLFTDTTITWAAGTSGTIQIPITVVDDLIYELDEKAKFQLINATNGAAFLNDTFLLTIKNNDAQPSGDCSDLFFSEYVLGSNNNKALEIYNPTAATINLSNYRIYKSVNGGTSSSIFGLSGLLASKATYVVANGSADAAILAVADTTSGFFNYTGNDALALLNLTDTIDVIGQIGVDPGTSWPVGTGSTVAHTLIRSFYTYQGDDNWNNAAETYMAYPNNLFDSLGFHNTAPCGTPEPIPMATLRFVSAGSTVVEFAGYVPVIIEIANPTASTVNFVVANDNSQSTAQEGIDHIFTAATRAFGPGTFFDTVYIQMLQDLRIESTETALLRFINMSANVHPIPDSTFTLTIIDNDTLTVGFLGAGYTFSESAGGPLAIKVILSSPVADTTKVNVSLGTGSATVNSDFLFNDTTIVFPPFNNDTQLFYITILEDVVVEGNEEFNLNLTNATNGAVIGSVGFATGCTITIIDNDAVGISTINLQSSIKVYPNPAKNVLNIQTEFDLSKVVITDMLGTIVYSNAIILAGNYPIKLSELSNGMYLISMSSTDQTITKRFIKAD